MDKLRINIPAWMLERRVEPPYVVTDLITTNFRDVFQAAPGQDFYELIAKHMNEYIQKGVMPPEEISPAIMNLIDDMTSGRKLTLRAGDYISLKNYLRKNK